MKLFHKLLVAPAALGLITPISANASEVNLNDISNYSDVESIEFANSFNNDNLNSAPLLAGGEGLVDDHSHDGSFSETTTASFSANFYIGAINDDDNAAAGANDLDDAVSAGYDFQIGLETSFTGEDSLTVTIDAGQLGANGISEFGGDDTDDALNVDGVAYTFPLGDKMTVMVGDNNDGSSLFTTACVYGGPGDTLDACGANDANFANGGAMAAASYDFGTGLTAAVGYAGGEASLMSEEGVDAWGLNAAYTAENYGVSISYAKVETAPPLLAGTTFADAGHEDTFVALQGYYTPEGGFPSISVGYQTGEDGSVVGNNDSTSNYFVGLTWDEVGPGSAGIALGTKAPIVEDADDEMMYEAYYSYPLNDGMTITPLVFMKEHETAGTDNETGVMVKTSFSF